MFKPSGGLSLSKMEVEDGCVCGEGVDESRGREQEERREVNLWLICEIKGKMLIKNYFNLYFSDI